MLQEEKQELPKDTALFATELMEVELLEELVLICLESKFETTNGHEEQVEDEEIQ